MPIVLITGGTGLIGTSLTDHLIKKGYDVIVLTRSKKGKAERPGLTYAEWDIKKQSIDTNALAKADHIIHLAGAGVVDKKWTADYKKEILDSRTQSIRLILETLRFLDHHVKTLTSASAIGWYGEDKEKGFAFTENDPASNDFLGETCKLWEESVDPAKALGLRVSKLRTGIVLSTDGGALAEFAKPIHFGVAGILSTGDQVVSWIHIEDLCRMYRFCIEHDGVHGAYNAVAPAPVTNKALTMSLAKEMKGSFFVPLHVPEFVLKLMMGERSKEVLKSTTVSCTKIKEAGFTFIYPTLEPALQNLLKK